MHPGWCATDMGGPQAPTTALDGAIKIYDCMWVKERKPDSFWNEKWVDYISCD
mgnify:CR=1 FL=1